MTRKLFHEEEHKTQLAFANGFVESVYGDLNDIKHSFFRIGFRLCEAAKLGYYKTLGYANITDLALDKFNFSKSTTYELMAIHELARGETPLLMAPQYEEFSQSQLRELCRLKMDSPGFMRIVKPSDKVATIGFAVTFWNKYVFKHSGGPQVKNINDLLELDIDTPLDAVERVLEMRKARKTANFDSVENSAYAEKSEPEQENYDGQLPGQTKLSLEEETPANSKFSAYAENSVVSDEEYDRLIKDLDRLIAGKPQLTDDELAVYCIRKYGTGHEDGKFRLCDKVNYCDFTTSEFINFVKKEYGHYGALVNDKFHKGIEATNRGLEITRLTGGKLILSWSTVAGRIKRLIESGEYLSAEEQEEYARKSLTPALKNSYETGDGLEWVDPVPVVGKTAMQSSAELTPRRRTRRQYLSELPDEEFVTHLLLQIAKVYPLKGDSAALISSMRKRLIDWLNQPQEVTE